MSGVSLEVQHCSLSKFSLLTVCLQMDMQPVYESNLYVYLYFLVFAISCFYTLNFFFRFIMASLQKAKICIYKLVTVFVTTNFQLFPVLLSNLNQNL